MTLVPIQGNMCYLMCLASTGVLLPVGPQTFGGYATVLCSQCYLTFHTHVMSKWIFQCHATQQLGGGLDWGMVREITFHSWRNYRKCE